MFAVYAQGSAPFSRIHATATEVSSPPEKAMPTRSPTGRDWRTLDMLSSLSACGVSPRAASDDGDSHAEGCVCDHGAAVATEERHTSCASAERDQSVVHRSAGDPGVGENVDGR